jgi:hypothetical protein
LTHPSGARREPFGVAANGFGGAFKQLTDEAYRERQGGVGQHLECRHRGNEQRQRRIDQSDSNRRR